MKKMTYKQAGVDIEAGYEVVKIVKKFADVGHFGGFFPIDSKRALVAGTDGVGTKLKVAFALNKHDTIGIDLVAMSVNDVLACGAAPLFFLDYYGCHKVEPKIVGEVIKGIVKGCKMSGCKLIGGETAELSDMYKKGEYDLAGFCIGIVEKAKIINGSTIKSGDVLIGLASSGVHSNGYTLARKVLGNKDGRLITPTKIYVKPVLNALKKVKIKGIAHITGGGLPENVARILPNGTDAIFDTSSWKIPSIFTEIQEKGRIDRDEMFKVFNMGIGMVLAVDKKNVKLILKLLKSEKAKVIGKITKGNQKVILCPASTKLF